MEESTYSPELENYLQRVQENAPSIPAERKKYLDQLAEYIRITRSAGNDANLIFICTHNSRRSHLSQIFAAIAADHFGLDHVKTYSGGTEATAMNPRVVQALERAGFKIRPDGGSDSNPVYSVQFAPEKEPLLVFSKTYDDPANPSRDFAAVMTCSDAEENCPFIPGATARLSVKYEDPKVADGTSYESERYDERTQQIAEEMFYAMKKASHG